ncbi:MAG: hypothetical protein LBC46_01880, partial [Treponema sp.]|nr:hypothetical protein [Treponema sp.]
IVPKKATFSLAASDKPKKAEIIFKISGIKTVDKPMLTISFKSPAQSVYNKVVTLGVKKPVSTICGFSRITVDFLSFLIQ